MAAYTALEMAAALTPEGQPVDPYRRRVQHWATLGIIDSERSPIRRGDREPWTFSLATGAATAVLFALYDHAGVIGHDALRRIYRGLVEPELEGDGALIDAILHDVAAGHEPFLIVNRWASRDGKETLTLAVRLEEERSIPIEFPPGAHFLCTELVMVLATLVAQWAGRNVVTFPGAN